MWSWSNNYLKNSFIQRKSFIGFLDIILVANIMDKYLRPNRLDMDPNHPNAAREWSHWSCTFENFLVAIKAEGQDRFKTLVNYVSPDVYGYIAQCTTYDDAIATLKSIYVKPKNEVFARYVLSTRRQDSAESIDQYVQIFRQLDRVQFQNCEDKVRDAFISGIKDNSIRKRLLENITLDLEAAVTQAQALTLAQENAEFYM